MAADRLAMEEEVTVAVASTEAAKKLTRRDEAETVAVVAVATCLPFLPRRFSTATGIPGAAIEEAGISKTARHTGHLKGGLSIF